MTKAIRKVGFYISDSIRPGAGAHLFAHTAVALGGLGLIDGATVPGATLRTVIGSRAIKWHVGQGNFERTSAGVKLTPEGLDHFTRRGADPELIAAFESVLIDGKTSDVAGVKNPAFVKPLAS